MKDILRRNVSVNEEVADLLNKQINMEYQSSAAYLAMAGWCEHNGYENSANHFYLQAEEEREHMMKIHKYLVQMGVQPVSGQNNPMRNDFSGLRDIYETYLTAEIEVTDSIHNIVSVARKNNDLGSENFLAWFVTEQMEEETTARRALELLDLMGEDKLALFMFDERIAGLSEGEGEAETEA